MDNLTIYNIRNLVKNNKIEWTEHSSLRMFERVILKSDIKNAILNGEIIEHYPTDYPYPSCLISGISNNTSLHIVCSIGKGYLYIITVYYPNEIKWISETKRRK